MGPDVHLQRQPCVRRPGRQQAGRRLRRRAQRGPHLCARAAGAPGSSCRAREGLATEAYRADCTGWLAAAMRHGSNLGLLDML
jgi:hypothetical protein